LPVNFKTFTVCGGREGNAVSYAEKYMFSLIPVNEELFYQNCSFGKGALGAPCPFPHF